MPFNLDRVEVVIERAFQRVSMKRENRILKHARNAAPPFRIIGPAPMEPVRFLISKNAPPHVPMPITGERNAGKNGPGLCGDNT